MGSLLVPWIWGRNRPNTLGFIFFCFPADVDPIKLDVADVCLSLVQRTSDKQTSKTLSLTGSIAEGNPDKNKSSSTGPIPTRS